MPLEGMRAEDEEDLPEDALVNSRYRILTILGRGNFSTTYLAEELRPEPEPPDIPRKVVAIKRLKYDFASAGENEFLLLQFLHSPSEGRSPKHIITPIESFFSESQHFHLVLERLDSARPVSLPECHCSTASHSKLSCPIRHLALSKMIVQILSGLLSLHSYGLIHADLTPGNILFLPGSNRIKIIDLGNTIRPEDREAYTDDFEVQSGCYRAPEMLLGSGPLSRVMDVWSAGVISVEMLLDDVVVGGGVEGSELLWNGIQGREGMVRRVVELVGSVRAYRGGMYYKDLYDELSITAPSTSPTAPWKRKRGGASGSGKRRQSRISVVEAKGILPGFLKKETGDEGLAVFLVDMMEVDMSKRKGVMSMLRHPWLIDKLLGNWGDVLMAGTTEFDDGKSDISATQPYQINYNWSTPLTYEFENDRTDIMRGNDVTIDAEPSKNESDRSEIPETQQYDQRLSQSRMPLSASVLEQPPKVKEEPPSSPSISLVSVAGPGDVETSPLELSTTANEDITAITLEPLGEHFEIPDSSPPTSPLTKGSSAPPPPTDAIFNTHIVPPPKSSLPFSTKKWSSPNVAREEIADAEAFETPAALEFQMKLLDEGEDDEDGEDPIERSEVWHRDLAAYMDRGSNDEDDDQDDDEVMLL
ncbi:hypothetical protein RUND412_003515 [Rhizina undulata]